MGALVYGKPPGRDCEGERREQHRPWLTSSAGKLEGVYVRNLEMHWADGSHEDVTRRLLTLQRPGAQYTSTPPPPAPRPAPHTGEEGERRPVGFPGLMMHSTLGSQWSLASRKARRSSSTFRAQQFSSSR